ncbi:MAG: tetratricopeptide repeat protein [Deltaproteobacteria bacterium]|nr:tetratricopeptide repeat protein [Deltaproteobacteria bacterium]
MAAYSNTLDAAWHFDDLPNILDNENVHVSTLSLKALSSSIHSPFAYPGNEKPKLYRPVAMLTFAINWYLGRDGVLGYHLVNIGIHCATAVMLYFTILGMLGARNVRGNFQGSERTIAFLATAFWALHPIQTQAVTYIVQRMASLATFFYVVSIYFYVRGRSASSPGKRVSSYLLCLLGFVLALGTKQNTVTLPAALLLVELVFYSDLRFLRKAKGRWIASSLAVVLVLFVLLGLYLWSDEPLSRIVRGYDIRPFNLSERVLTEFRVLVLYLKQIVYPIPQQFSIIHDVGLSTSLLLPWTTLASIVLIAGLIIGAIATLSKYRLLSFGILFYFLGHSVESTVFPLELVFEHRNYLPTLFLFLPLASGLVALMAGYRRQNRLIHGLLAVFVAALIFGIGFATYVRNAAWATEKTIWQDAMQKAPALARPHQGLALALENENRLDPALELYEKALTLEDPSPKLSRFISLSNMGNIYKKKGEYVRAASYLTAALDYDTGPYMRRIRYNLVLCLLNSNGEKAALNQIDVLLGQYSRNVKYMSTKGFILFLQGRFNQAEAYLKSALERNPGDNLALVNLAMVLSATGRQERADQYLQRAGKRDPKNIVIYLGLLQNAVKMQDRVKTDRYLHQLTAVFTIDQIERFFNAYEKGYRYIDGRLVPLSGRTIFPRLAAYLKEQANRIDGASAVRM